MLILLCLILKKHDFDTFYEEINNIYNESKNAKYQLFVTILGNGKDNEELTLVYDNKIKESVLVSYEMTSNSLLIDLKNQWGETIDTLSLTPTQSSENLLDIAPPYLIVSNELLTSWFDQYDGISITGNLLFESEDLQRSEIQLNNEITRKGDSYLYISNNSDIKQQYMQTRTSIRILVYSLNFIIIFVCIFLIYNILSQYLQNKKNEIQLLSYIGMQKNQIKMQYMVQALIYAFLSIFIILPIYLMITNYLNNYILLNTQMIFAQILYVSIIIIILFVILMKLNVRRIFKELKI